ncbi:MAG: efflux RND transporter permease subunit [Balneolaceae bacterium]
MTEIFRRRYFISLTYILIVVVGVAAWMNIPVEMAPDLNLPSVSVSYSWGSTSPEVMEQEVTRAVERAATRLRNVDNISSTSGEGSSWVSIRFEKDTPVEYRVLELQEYLNGIQEQFPPEVSTPRISRQIPQELRATETFMAWSISGDRPATDLYRFARDNIQMPLLGLEGLADIEIYGAEDPALTVRFNTARLEHYDIDPNTVLRTIRERLNWRSAGFTEQGGLRFSTLIPPDFSSVDDIRRMEIELPQSQRRIPLYTIAEVNVEDYPLTSIKRLNGKTALTMDFLHESGTDALELAEEVRDRMDHIRSIMPADITMKLERDSTEELRRQFSELQYQSVYSLLTVFFILLLFIRRFRAPFLILGSILFSLLMSVSILFFIGYTLNVLTLAGLTVALGMIVDNAVVVFEQVNPGLPAHRTDRMEHIRRELPYTLVPVLGSTLTTVGIFVPLFFTMEQLQIFLVPLAVALTLTLASSVLIALSWIPYALIWLVPPSSRQKDRTLKKRLSRMLDRFLIRGFHLRHRMRWVFYIGFMAAIGLPIFAIEEPDWEETSWPEMTRIYFDNRSNIDPWVGGLPYIFFNDVYFGSPWGGSRQERITVTIRAPQGTPLEETDKIARNYEAIADPYLDAFDYYETNVRSLGAATSQLVFYIKDEYIYRMEPYMFLGEAFMLAARTGNYSISVSGLGESQSVGSFGMSSGSQRITLRGFSYDELVTLAEDIAWRMKRNPRVQEVDIHNTGFGAQQQMSQFVLNLDEQRIASLGLNRGSILNAIRLDANPTNQMGDVELLGERMRLIGRNMELTNYTEDFFNRARRSGGQFFTLADVAHLSKEATMPRIDRENQAYTRTVGVNFLGPYRLANTYITGVLEEVPVPVGASIQYGNSGFFGWGQSGQTRSYVILLLFTILSVWMIVSALLENWRDPMVVILAVPLSLIGVMAGSLWHDISFDRGALAGTLLAVGVVVNNSILLVHEKQRCRALGIFGYRSWVRVYRNKMRAVMITSLTTIGGLVPLVLIGSDAFWTDLATVVIWGLGTSLTLLLLLMGVWEANSGLRRSPLPGE